MLLSITTVIYILHCYLANRPSHQNENVRNIEKYNKFKYTFNTYIIASKMLSRGPHRCPFMG